MCALSQHYQGEEIKTVKMVLLEDMIEAYYDCRRNKRNTVSAVEFEMNYEVKLLDLVRRINDRSYRPGKSICFVVKWPRYREVFAAAFEDRIPHHYIYNRLNPLFEGIFGDRTFNCREGKGQLYGVKMLADDLHKCSNNYTTDCYVLKLDIKAFFMSIDKPLLVKLVDDFIVENYVGDDKEDLRFLCKVVIMHNPEKNCELRSPLEYWDHLPKEKSLFTNGEGKGVAIGNLFAQLFANFLLWSLEGVFAQYGISVRVNGSISFFRIQSPNSSHVSTVIVAPHREGDKVSAVCTLKKEDVVDGLTILAFLTDNNADYEISDFRIWEIDDSGGGNR